MPMDLQTKLCSRVAEMFLRFGIKSVSMDDISRDLGISKKTLYGLITNKKELVAKILENFMVEEHKQVDVIRVSAKDPIHELILIAKHVTKMLKKISPTTMYDLRKYYRDQWRSIEIEREEMINTDIKRNLKTGISKGVYRKDLDVDLLTTLYLNMATYIMDEKILDQPQPRKIKLYIEFIKYHIRGIATAKGIKTFQKYEHLLNDE